MVAISEPELEKRLKAIGELKTAYQMLFGTGDPVRAAAVGAVVADLRKFCRAATSTWSEDQRHHARLEGRREVWLHLDDWLRLPEEELLQRTLGDNFTVIKVDPNENEDW